MSDAFSGPDEGRTVPQPLGATRWDWAKVRRVLVVRLRSIGDTVLATPALAALRRFLPHAQIDMVLEDWVAPLLVGAPELNRVWAVPRRNTRARLELAYQLRRAKYDVAYNLHGGTTATLLMRAAGARRRVGFDTYQYQALLTDAAPPSSTLWGRTPTHSAEQQLALIGWTGIPVTDRPRSRVPIADNSRAAISKRLSQHDLDTQPYALIHPAAAFTTKQWAAENFARIAETLHDMGLRTIAIGTPAEAQTVQEVVAAARVPVIGWTDLRLPEVVPLIDRARVFVGNDSGLAHIAAARETPSVVIFGSSNLAHWRPWTLAPHRIVRETLPCQPCAGYECHAFAQPECIRRVSVSAVRAALSSLFAELSKNNAEAHTE